MKTVAKPSDLKADAVYNIYLHGKQSLQKCSWHSTQLFSQFNSNGKDAWLDCVVVEECPIWDAPHADASGASRRIVIASCLAGKDSGEIAMHMTPAEEREYNRGMEMMAAMG